jgi:hypothetical protein
LIFWVSAEKVIMVKVGDLGSLVELFEKVVWTSITAYTHTSRSVCCSWNCVSLSESFTSRFSEQERKPTTHGRWLGFIFSLGLLLISIYPFFASRSLCCEHCVSFYRHAPTRATRFIAHYYAPWRLVVKTFRQFFSFLFWLLFTKFWYVMGSPFDAHLFVAGDRWLIKRGNW